MKRARSLQISRVYRDAGSWWRFAPAIAIAAALHVALIFPERFGFESPRGSSEPSANAGGPRLIADGAALARAFAELLHAAPPAVEPVKPEPEPAPEPPSPAIAASVVTPKAPEVREPEPAPEEAPVPVEVPAPERSERRKIEGDAGEAPPEREAPASPLAPHATPAPPPRPVSETELQRDALQRSLRRIDDDGGHLAAAHRRFEEQAASKRASARGGAEGSDLGLPQLYVYAIPEGAAFVSYLELFGGEVFAHAGGESFVHFGRDGAQFQAQAMTRRELDRLAAERGLNLGYVLPLDDVTARLPAPLTSQLEDARRRAGAGAWRVFVLGTTREQAAVAAAAQEHLRHHREEAPGSRLWAELERIEFRYLVDSSDRVYGVGIDAVHGKR